uniref:Amino_oxidase domain-containing protein n=1 Tax=Wuchereria bancrofti TaxID=6293 RepID=A0AAF5RVI0_WUCBA
MSSLKVDKGFRLVIIGAGPTAFGMLHRIYSLITEGIISKEDIQIIVLEKEDEVGGLARSVTDEKGFTWDLGVHVLGVSKYPEFEKVINSAVNKWNKVRRSAKADLAHLFKSDNSYSNYVPYPVQHSIPYFPPTIRQKCINELKDLQGLPVNCSNFAEYSANIFGNTLLDIFIRPYNRKVNSDFNDAANVVIGKESGFTVFVSVWTVELEEMNAFWAWNRIPNIDLSSIELHCGRSRQELENDLRSSMACFKYPRDYKGVGKIWKKIAERYPESIFHFQERVRRIDIEAKKVITEDLNRETHSYDYNAVLSTLPIPELSKISAVISDVNLKHSKVILVGLGLKYPQCEWTQFVTWAYFPLPDTIFYRCTFLSNFNDNLTPDCNQFWSVLCEIGLEADANFVEEEVIVKVIEGLKLKGIIADNNEIVDKWLCILPYGYPIPTVNRDEELQRCHEAFQAHNIYSRGRFGGWKYEISNQDHCFMMGMQCADLILLEVKETLYTF